MKTTLHLLLITVILNILGCASIQPVVSNNTAPDNASGYIAGKFTRSKGIGFAFIVRDVLSNKEYYMSLGEDSTFPTEVKDQVVAIKLPPGRYSVSEWVTYGTLTKERSAKRQISNPVLSMPFSVGSGAVIYLGNFQVDTTYSGGYPVSTIYYSIKPKQIELSTARADFRRAYPLFDSNAFDCKLCTDYLLKTPFFNN